MTGRQTVQMFSIFKIAAVSARTRRRKSASSISDTPSEGIISFSLGSQPAAVSSFGKHFSKTLIPMKAAVDAPGEAPSSATSERSAADHGRAPVFAAPFRDTTGAKTVNAN